MANQAEGTFGRLRYSLGGDRPSQTTRLTLSPTRIHGPGLEPQYMKGGISRLTPPKLTLRFPSLPPILHSIYRNPTSNCSKGPRGLSVLLRETSIFTRRAISPGLWLRQQPSRYAIRAGRNFALFRCFQRGRLCLHLETLDRGQDHRRFVSAFAARIHRRRQSDDHCEAGRLQMFSSNHALAGVCEQLEVLMLAGPQRGSAGSEG